MRNGSGVGMVLGASALVGAVFLLARARSAAAASASLGTGRGRDFVPPKGPSVAPGPVGHFPILVSRWRPEVEKRAKDLPVEAVLEWIRLESGGDMCSVGNPSEVGIFQLSFPSDAKYGTTLGELRALCEKSHHQDPTDISWLSPRDLEGQVGSGIRKILAARDRVRQVFAANDVNWPELSFDFGSAVKQIHAAPAVITELVPKIVRRDGVPNSWIELRRRVMAFPVSQMGDGLRRLWEAPSRHGLKNRLEDTLQNAEAVGRAWASGEKARVAVHGWGGYV